MSSGAMKPGLPQASERIWSSEILVARPKSARLTS